MGFESLLIVYLNDELYKGHLSLQKDSIQPALEFLEGSSPDLLLQPIKRIFMVMWYLLCGRVVTNDLNSIIPVHHLSFSLPT